MLSRWDGKLGLKCLWNTFHKAASFPIGCLHGEACCLPRNSSEFTIRLQIRIYSIFWGTVTGYREWPSLCHQEKGAKPLFSIHLVFKRRAGFNFQKIICISPQVENVGFVQSYTSKSYGESPCKEKWVQDMRQTTSSIWLCHRRGAWLTTTCECMRLSCSSCKIGLNILTLLRAAAEKLCEKHYYRGTQRCYFLPDNL